MKILCLPYTHTLSHISRPLAVCNELRNRGHKIFFAGESQKTKIITSENFQVFPLYEPDPEKLFGNIRAGKLKFVETEEIEKMIESDLELFRDVQPELVITDGRFSAPLSTALFGVKHCAIVNASSTEYRELPYMPFFEWIPNRLQCTPIKKWLDRLNLVIEMFVFNNVMSSFKKLCRKYKLNIRITATNCLTGNDLTLLADIPDFFPTQSLQDNYYYIGPLTLKSNLPTPEWWPPQASAGSIIYITMGTTGISDFFPMICKLFKNSQHTVILTTGGQKTVLTDVDNKIYVEEYLDGDLVMEASDLVVCHGGNGTIYQALQHGKPIIGIPTIPDQKFNMRRVEALSVGKSLSWGDFVKKPRLLLDMIDLVSSDETFGVRANVLKEKIATYDPVRKAANLIEDVLLNARNSP